MNIFLSIRTLNQDEIAQGEEMFSFIREDKQLSKDTWTVLHKQIKEIPVDQLYQYRNTYVTWYAILSWDLVMQLSREDLLDVVARTIVAAFREDIPVWKRCITYLHVRTTDQEDLEFCYAAIKRVVEKSEETVCVLEGKQITLASMIQMVDRYEREGNDLALAQYYSDLELAIKKGAGEASQKLDEKNVILLLKDWIHFILGIESTNIYYVVDTYFYPQKYGESKELTLGDEFLDEELEETSGSPSPNDSQYEHAGDVPETNNIYAFIKTQIQSEFPETTTGGTEQLEAIFTRLDELATEHNQPDIRELYIFDEETGSFTWNKALLS